MTTTKLRSQTSSNVLARKAMVWNGVLWFLTSALAAFGLVWTLGGATPTEAAGISTSGQVVETKMNALGTEIYMLDAGADTLEVIEASSGNTLSSISMPLGTGAVQDMDWDHGMGVAYVSTSTGDIIQVDPVGMMAVTLLSSGPGSYGQICVDTVTAGDVVCTMDLGTMDLYGVSNIGGLTLLGSAPYTSQGDLFELIDASTGTALPEVASVGSEASGIRAWFLNRTTSFTRAALYTGMYAARGAAFDGFDHVYVGARHLSTGSDLLLRLDITSGGWGFGPALKTYSSGDRIVDVAITDHYLSVLLDEASTNDSKVNLWDVAGGVSPLEIGHVTLDGATPSGGLTTWSEGGGSPLEIYSAFATAASGGVGEIHWDPGNDWDPVGGPAITGTGWADKLTSGGWSLSQEAMICIPCERDHPLAGALEVPDDVRTASAPQATPGSVQYATGEEVYVRPLFSIPGIGMDLDVTLTYRSRSDHDYRYGRGWFLNHDIRMKTEANGDETVQSGYGRQDIYTKVLGNYYAPLHHDTGLVVSGGGVRTITDRFGQETIVNASGYVTSVADRYGNTISYTWTGDKLTGITDTRGQVYSLAYGADGRLSSITDYGSRVWTFSYDYMGQLIGITTPVTAAFTSGRTYRFGYTGNHATTALRGNLRHVVSPMNDIVQTLVYNADDLVVEERIGPGTFTMSYHDPSKTVTVVDRSNNTTEYVFDTDAVLVSTEVFTKGLRSGEPSSYLTEYTPGSSGLIETIVYPRGNRVDLTYDSDLNLTEVRRKTTDTSSTSSSDIVTEYEYTGAYSQRTKRTDPNGNVTTYTVDSDGNTTAINRPAITNPTSQTITESFTYDAEGRILTATDGEGRVTEFEYYAAGGSAGWLENVIRDPSNLALTTTIQYGTWGAVTAVTDPRGNTTTFTVDDEGYVTEVQAPSPLSIKSRFAYDANRSLTLSELENRDKDGVLDGTTPWITTTYTVDEMGWRTEVERPLTSSTSATTSYTYTNAGLVDTVTDPTGGVTKIEYDERDFVFKVTRGYGTADATTVRVDYDANGGRVKVIDGRSNDATWTRDLFDRVTRATDRLGHYVDFTYDKNGNALTVKAYTSGATLVAETERFFDEIDRLWKVKRHRFGTGLSSSYPTTTIQHDESGRVVAVTDPSGGVTTRTYDDAGRAKTAVDDAGNKVEWFLDENGNVTKIESTDIPDAGGSETYTTNFGYDVLNRRTSMGEVDRLNGSNVLATSFAYDSQGNLVFRVDAEGHPVRWTYDLAGRLTQVERALSTGTGPEDFTSAITETFAYDLASRLTQVTDDNFNSTSYMYDVLGRSTRTTYADTKVIDREFDENGNVVEWTDQNGSVVTNSYDEEDRLYARDISRGTGVGGVTSETFGRDALGRIVLAVNNDYRVVLDWDSVGNLLSDKQGYAVQGSEQWKTASATYSLAGAMTGLIYPDTFAISHGRDSIHRLTSITDVGSTATIVDYAWQGLGRKASATNENGTVTEYAYDGFRRVTEIDHKLSGAGASFHLLEYAYDDVHNRRMEKHSFDATWISGLPGAVQTFLNARDAKGDVYEYDWAYRMVTAKYSVSNPASEVATPGSQTYVTKTDYALDGLGNRSQVGVTPYGGGTATTTYSSDVVNQYTSIASVSRTHDDNGNLTDDGTQEYVYDYANHLIEVKASGSSTIATYMYDALGRRVEKDVSGGSVTRYLLWGQSIIEEVDGSGTWLARYIQTDQIDFPCAMDRADIADVDGDTNTSEVLRFHYHQQTLGSVTEISDENGAVVEWVTYDVYGAATIRNQAGSTVGSSALGSPFLFTGREYDAESGLYHYRARAYDPEAGRFLQRDPLGYVDGLSAYQYVMSSPINHVDPSGTTPSGADRLNQLAKDALARVERARNAAYGPGGSGERLVAATREHSEAKGEYAAATARYAEALARVNALRLEMDLLVLFMASLQRDNCICLAPDHPMVSRFAQLAELLEEAFDQLRAAAEATATAKAALDDASKKLASAEAEHARDVAEHDDALDELASVAGEFGREALHRLALAALSFAGGAAAGKALGLLAKAAKAGAEAAKIGPKIAKQMGPRGWTQEGIREAIQSGKQVGALNKATGNAATRYVHPKTGQSVVVDNVTGEVIHVGGPGFKHGPGSGDLP